MADNFWTKLGEWGAQLAKIGGGVSVILLVAAALTDYTPLRNKIADIAGTPQLIKTLENLNNGLDKLTDKVDQIDSRIKRVEDRLDYADENGLGGRAAAIKFMENGNSISDSYIGSSVTFNIRFVNLRDCGRPKITAWFKNGRKVPHSFRNISFIDKDGRPPARKADPQNVIEDGFVAWIPLDDAVTTGPAYGWVEVGDYEFCPNVPVVSSPQIPFTIKSPDDRPPERN